MEIGTCIDANLAFHHLGWFCMWRSEPSAMDPFTLQIMITYTCNIYSPSFWINCRFAVHSSSSSSSIFNLHPPHHHHHHRHHHHHHCYISSSASSPATNTTTTTTSTSAAPAAAAASEGDFHPAFTSPPKFPANNLSHLQSNALRLQELFHLGPQSAFKQERGRPCARVVSIENTIFQQVHQKASKPKKSSHEAILYSGTFGQWCK